MAKTEITITLEKILTAIYGEQMRQHIHDAIKAVNDDLNEVKDSKAQPNGIATLGRDGKIPDEQLPDLSIVDTEIVNSEAAMLALNVQKGDFAIRTDINQLFILKQAPASNINNWHNMGIIVLKKADIGLGNVDNTADKDKDVLSATKLTTPRKISGVEFDGTKDITLTKDDVGLDKVDNTADKDKDVRSAGKLTNPVYVNDVPFDGSKNVTIYDDSKEPKIDDGTDEQYITGDKKLANLALAVLSVVISNLQSIDAGVPITEEDSIVTALAKLQAQIDEIKEKGVISIDTKPLEDEIAGYESDIRSLHRELGDNYYNGSQFNTEYDENELDGGSFDGESEESFDCGEFDEPSE